MSETVNIYTSHFLNLDPNCNIHYLNRYVKLMESLPVANIGENHHILPKSMFPEFHKSQWNIKKISLRSHFIAHNLLFKIFSIGKYKSSMAFVCVARGKGIINSRLYETLLIEHRIATSIKMTGSKRSEETKQKMSVAHTGKVFSATHLQNMSLSRLGKPKSKETRERMSLAAKGRTHTQQTKQKMSQSHLGLSNPTVTCPHCGKVGGKGGMVRWHFNNCVSLSLNI